MKKTFAFVLPLLCLLAVSSVSAQAPFALYWDPGMSGGAALGGSGIWDTNPADANTAVWFDGAADVVWNTDTNANNNDAWFEGTGGTVTLAAGDNVSVADLYFTNVTGGYYITNTTGAEFISVANSIDTGGSEDTNAVPLVNSTTLFKNGDGRLHLPVANNLNNVTVNQGELSVENNTAAGASITVADGAALELNGGTNDNLNNFTANVTINGTGITNSGALRNTSGVTTFYGQIILGANNSMIYADPDTALVYDGENGPLTDNSLGYNLIISGSGTGNVQLGETSIGGSLIIEGTASCYAYLNSISPTAWTSTYIGPGASFYVENNNSFGTDPASLMTTNVILDGGTITSGGTYTMYANDGITVTTNGGTLVDNSGTWTTCNIYSPSNAPVTFNGSGSFRPGGAGSTKTVDLGTGTLIKGGSGDINVGYASTFTFSNLVLNGGSYSFNYDDSSGQTVGLGAVPASFSSSNIWFNGGSLHVGHSTTIFPNRGIYVASGGGTIEDVVSSGGTVTVDPPITGPGSMNFPDGHGGTTSTIILESSNSYAGTTTIGLSNILEIAGSGTLGMGNTIANGQLNFNRTGTYEYDGNISGGSNIIKNASGTIILTGDNTFVGFTTVAGGTLLIDNTTGSGTSTNAVYVKSGAALGGTGTISGLVGIASGGALSLLTNTFTINNSLLVTGNVTVAVNKLFTQPNGEAVVGAVTNYGTGTVTVNNLGPALVPGDTFTLFNQAVTGGASMNVTGGGTGGATVTWINNLAVNGSITVQAVVPPRPVVKQTQIVGGNVIISGINGFAGDTNIVLTTTNLVPPVQWTPISTNIFTGSAFSITNPIDPGAPQQFYMLQVPY